MDREQTDSSGGWGWGKGLNKKEKKEGTHEQGLHCDDFRGAGGWKCKRV